MPRYRKRPVVIEAIQYTGVNQNLMDELEGFVGHDLGVRDIDNVLHLVIRTLEGDMLAKPGDYIIKGVQGECYPCKPDIFDATYETA